MALFEALFGFKPNQYAKEKETTTMPSTAPTSRTKVTATVTQRGISAIINGKVTTIPTEHSNYKLILQALRDKNYDAIPDLLDVVKSISTSTQGKVTITNGQVLYKGQPTHNAVAKRMLEMVKLGVDVSHMMLFLENLMQNPSYRAREEAFRFMDACDMPITEDGYLLVYRSVNNDFYDRHTGRTAYSKPASLMDTAERAQMYRKQHVVDGVMSYIEKLRGEDTATTVVEMARADVNDNSNETCSAGLHVCSAAYGMFGRTLMLCKVNPRDIVSVPIEYQDAKMRVCRFEVIEVVDNFRKFDDEPVYGYRRQADGFQGDAHTVNDYNSREWL